jgi:hypothetical protein
MDSNELKAAGRTGAAMTLLYKLLEADVRRWASSRFRSPRASRDMTRCELTVASPARSRRS